MMDSSDSIGHELIFTGPTSTSVPSSTPLCDIVELHILELLGASMEVRTSKSVSFYARWEWRKVVIVVSHT